MEKDQTKLKEIYVNPESPGAFGGVKKLYDEVRKTNQNIKLVNIEKWLAKQDTYTLFKNRKKNFIRLPILVDRIDDQWQGDLLDMTWISRENDGYKYLFTVIDILSKHAWVEALKDKTGSSILKAFKKILLSGRKPEKLQTDQGREFKNYTFQNFLQENGIKFFTSTDDVIKCAVVERFNRTIRSRIYRYLHASHTKRYIDDIQSLVKGYNNSYHRTIGMAPNEVNQNNVRDVVINMRKLHRKSKVKVNPYNVGDVVRITRSKSLFEKGSTQNFTEERFKITKVKRTPQGYIYRICDLMNEPITSIFYHYELIKADEPDIYKVEKVIRTRVNPTTRKREYFVKWLGYPEKFNSWTDNVTPIR